MKDGAARIVALASNQRCPTLISGIVGMAEKRYKKSGLARLCSYEFRCSKHLVSALFCIGPQGICGEKTSQ